MRKTPLLALFALLAISACSQPAPTPDAHSAHAGMEHGAEPGAPVDAASASVGQLSISGAWVAATPGGADVGAGYLSIANAGPEDDRLIGLSSPRAARVETHEMAMDGAMMTMRKVDAIEIPAGGVATLSPGALHLMFFDISAPFVAGESVPVTLRFEHAGEVTLEAPVRSR